jgi:predicted dehydrogenase
MTALRWGILSTAAIARNKVVPGMRNARRCQVVAIASRDANAASTVANQLGIRRAHGSYEALLADDDVDAVYIPLPNHLHAPWSLAAIEAGKHVLCEKPLALSVDDATEMATAARSAGVHLMEAFMYRLHPSWLTVRRLIGEGRIGQLTAVQSWFSFYNDDPANIRNIADAGGGALWDIGCYSVNLSRMLFADEPVRIESTIRREPTSGVDVVASAILEFRDGTATFTCSTRAEDDQRVEIYGTTGRISVGIPFNIPPDRPTEVRIVSGGDPPVSPNIEVMTFPPADPYTIEVEAFTDAVLDGSPTPVPPDDAIENVRTIAAIFAAAEPS